MSGTSFGGHGNMATGNGNAFGGRGGGGDFGLVFGKGGGGDFIGCPGVHPSHGRTIDGVGDGGSDHAEGPGFGTAPGAGGWNGSAGTGGAGALTFAGTGMGVIGMTLPMLEPEPDFGEAGNVRLGTLPFPGDFTLALYSRRGGGREL